MGAIDDIESAGREQVGDSTIPSDIDGFKIIERDPSDLADSAGLDLNTYALARMVQSEMGSASALNLLVLAESARNEARHRGQSVSSLLLHSTMARANGLFSEQAAGKWASTRLDPNERHAAAARAALEDGSDLIRGARDFFDPKSQDSGQQGAHKLRITSEQYIAKNAARHLQWVGEIPGIDPYRLMVFGDVSGTVDQEPALAVLQRGREGIASAKGGGALLVILLAGAVLS